MKPPRTEFHPVVDHGGKACSAVPRAQVLRNTVLRRGLFECPLFMRSLMTAMS
jgi:hypothetical protein